MTEPFHTLKACRAWLTEHGYNVHGFQTDNGRHYLVTNFRGGRCFYGPREELIAETNTWYRYV